MFLISRESDSNYSWPLLRTILVARYKKREAQFVTSKQWDELKRKADKDWPENDGYFFQLAYLSQKLYGRRVEDIGDDRLETIKGFIKKSDQIWKF
jgi:hypothetical protein